MQYLQFKEFRKRIENGLRQELPGPEAQYKMAPLGRKKPKLSELDDARVKKAAVLALFYEEQQRPKVVLTLRVQYEGVHSGQISFPGGRREEHDHDFKETALRETHEEIGIPPVQIEVLGKLSPLYIPPSNFLVHPFVGISGTMPDFKKQQSEVAEILAIDFNKILDDGSVQEQTVSSRSFKQKVPVFKIDGIIIWGATAMMLSELRELVRR